MVKPLSVLTIHVAKVVAQCKYLYQSFKMKYKDIMYKNLSKNYNAAINDITEQASSYIIDSRLSKQWPED